jgi:hypothetical protein
MGQAKQIIVKPINVIAARDFVKKNHYSGKVVQNSILHFGCFLNGVLGGVMQFGSSLDKRKVQGLVKDTGWNDFLELNRMAFSNLLPRNSESRCIAIAMQLIKKHYPNIQWIISFADGCQCGDGTIYRASGFVLTSIKRNTGQRIDEKTGEVFSQVTFSAHRPNDKDYWKTLKKLDGFQFRYIYFIDKKKEQDLTVPVLPFSKIDELGAGMYKGKKISLKNRRV